MGLFGKKTKADVSTPTPSEPPKTPNVEAQKKKKTLAPLEYYAKLVRGDRINNTEIPHAYALANDFWRMARDEYHVKNTMQLLVLMDQFAKNKREIFLDGSSDTDRLQRLRETPEFLELEQSVGLKPYAVTPIVAKHHLEILIFLSENLSKLDVAVFERYREFAVAAATAMRWNPHAPSDSTVHFAQKMMGALALVLEVDLALEVQNNKGGQPTKNTQTLDPMILETLVLALAASPYALHPQRWARFREWWADATIERKALHIAPARAQVAKMMIALRANLTSGLQEVNAELAHQREHLERVMMQNKEILADSEYARVVVDKLVSKFEHPDKWAQPDVRHLYPLLVYFDSKIPYDAIVQTILEIRKRANVVGSNGNDHCVNDHVDVAIHNLFVALLTSRRQWAALQAANDDFVLPLIRINEAKTQEERLAWVMADMIRMHGAHLTQTMYLDDGKFTQMAFVKVAGNALFLNPQPNDADWARARSHVIQLVRKNLEGLSEYATTSTAWKGVARTITDSEDDWVKDLVGSLVEGYVGACRAHERWAEIRDQSTYDVHVTTNFEMVFQKDSVPGLATAMSMLGGEAVKPEMYGYAYKYNLFLSMAELAQLGLLQKIEKSGKTIELNGDFVYHPFIYHAAYILVTTASQFLTKATRKELGAKHKNGEELWEFAALVKSVSTADRIRFAKILYAESAAIAQKELEKNTDGTALFRPIERPRSTPEFVWYWTTSAVHHKAYTIQANVQLTATWFVLREALFQLHFTDEGLQPFKRFLVVDPAQIAGLQELLMKTSHLANATMDDVLAKLWQSILNQRQQLAVLMYAFGLPTWQYDLVDVSLNLRNDKFAQLHTAGYTGAALRRSFKKATASEPVIDFKKLVDKLASAYFSEDAYNKLIRKTAHDLARMNEDVSGIRATIEAFAAGFLPHALLTPTQQKAEHRDFIIDEKAQKHFLGLVGELMKMALGQINAFGSRLDSANPFTGLLRDRAMRFYTLADAVYAAMEDTCQKAIQLYDESGEDARVSLDSRHIDVLDLFVFWSFLMYMMAHGSVFEMTFEGHKRRLVHIELPWKRLGESIVWALWSNQIVLGSVGRIVFMFQRFGGTYDLFAPLQYSYKPTDLSSDPSVHFLLNVLKTFEIRVGEHDVLLVPSARTLDVLVRTVAQLANAHSGDKDKQFKEMLRSCLVIPLDATRAGQFARALTQNQDLPLSQFGFYAFSLNDHGLSISTPYRPNLIVSASASTSLVVPTSKKPIRNVLRLLHGVVFSSLEFLGNRDIGVTDASTVLELCAYRVANILTNTMHSEQFGTTNIGDIRTNAIRLVEFLRPKSGHAMVRYAYAKLYPVITRGYEYGGSRALVQRALLALERLPMVEIVEKNFEENRKNFDHQMERLETLFRPDDAQLEIRHVAFIHLAAAGKMFWYKLSALRTTNDISGALEQAAEFAVDASQTEVGQKRHAVLKQLQDIPIPSVHGNPDSFGEMFSGQRLFALSRCIEMVLPNVDLWVELQTTRDVFMEKITPDGAAKFVGAALRVLLTSDSHSPKQSVLVGALLSAAELIPSIHPMTVIGDLLEKHGGGKRGRFTLTDAQDLIHQIDPIHSGTPRVSWVSLFQACRVQLSPKHPPRHVWNSFLRLVSLYEFLDLVPAEDRPIDPMKTPEDVEHFFRLMETQMYKFPPHLLTASHIANVWFDSNGQCVLDGPKTQTVGAFNVRITTLMALGARVLAICNSGSKSKTRDEWEHEFMKADHDVAFDPEPFGKRVAPFAEAVVKRLAILKAHRPHFIHGSVSSQIAAAPLPYIIEVLLVEATTAVVALAVAMHVWMDVHDFRMVFPIHSSALNPLGASVTGHFTAAIHLAHDPVVEEAMHQITHPKLPYYPVFGASVAFGGLMAGLAMGEGLYGKVFKEYAEFVGHVSNIYMEQAGGKKSPFYTLSFKHIEHERAESTRCELIRHLRNVVAKKYNKAKAEALTWHAWNLVKKTGKDFDELVTLMPKITNSYWKAYGSEADGKRKHKPESDEIISQSIINNNQLFLNMLKELGFDHKSDISGNDEK